MVQYFVLQRLSDVASALFRRDKDGNPTFERTGTVGGNAEPPQPRFNADKDTREGVGSYRDPWKSPSRPYSSDTQYNVFRDWNAEDDNTEKLNRQAPRPAGYVPSVEYEIPGLLIQKR